MELVSKPPRPYDPAWWTPERRRKVSERAKAWHEKERATNPHLIARAEAEAKGWPFTPLPHRRRGKT